MRGDAARWLTYAEDNLRAAAILLDGNLYNPCLQNCQQAVEKLLKAVLVEMTGGLRKTHSVSELRRLLLDRGIALELLDDECDLLDSIYVPSKYPLGSALPDFDPDSGVCATVLALARKIDKQVRSLDIMRG